MELLSNSAMANLMGTNTITLMKLRKEGLPFIKEETGRKEVKFNKEEVVKFLEEDPYKYRRYLSAIKNSRNEVSYRNEVKNIILKALEQANGRKVSQIEAEYSIKVYERVLYDLSRTPNINTLDRLTFERYHKYFKNILDLITE